MPRRFLSQAERQQLSQFPPLISENDLIVYFTLTPADIVIIKQQREAHNRLGFAMLLCALRYLGFFPTDIRHPPANVVTYVASQLQLPATAIADYAVRDETRREHLIGVMNHLGFRRPQETDKEQLTAWLGERTLENDRPSSLLQLACERLYQLRLVRPAVTTMEELVIDARQWAQEKTIQVLVEPLPADKRQRLSTLLEPIKGKGITPLTWLRRSAIGHSDRDILDTLAKLAFIRQWSVEKWSVDQLPPSRLKFLAQLARHTSNQGLKRKKPVEKRDAILTAFLLWAYEKTIDELIDLFDLCLADAFRKSRRELKEYQLAHVAQMQKVVEYFQEMTGILMAELTDLSYARLVWCANWYIREETLQAVANVLVNFQYQQQLSHYWGTGIFSSSDGQRFAVARKMNRATPLPRYFGYGRGLTFLTWTSDQLSQYGTRVTPPTIRESTLVLDAILDNETDLNIQEHTTDTAGYTDLVFALFDLLGLQFSPRLRDIGGHNLYCLDASIKYKRIGPLISRPLDIDLIVENWDDLLRVAASLKMGWVTASTLISKLQAFPRQHKLTQVLQEYGRLVKTIFILHYIDDEQYRRRVLVQLNKGEAIHKLRRFLFFDNQGRLRRQQPEDLVNQAGCLNVLSNAIIVWNTVYMQAVLDDLTAREHPINEADLVHLSPARFGHINPYGKFRFDFSDYLDSSGLRPLRSS